MNCFSLFNSFIFVCLLFFSQACEQKSQTSHMSYETQTLLRKSQDLQERLSKKVILSNSTTQEHQIFSVHLKQIEYALIYLSKNPKDQKSYDLLTQSLSTLMGLSLSKSDEALIQSFLSETLTFMESVAQKNSISLLPLTLPLFTTYFGGQLEPFRTFGSSDLWRLQMVQGDKTFVSVQTRNNSSWLITPTFDLSEVSNPFFSITHSITLNQNFRFDIDKLALLDQGFKVYATTDYPIMDPEDSKIIWEELSLGSLPDTQEFHFIKTAPLTLEKFQGKRVTLGFKFSNPTDHYLGWSLSQFQLLGKGLLKVEKNAGPLIKLGFQGPTLTPFVSMNDEGAPSSWKFSTFKDNKFALIDSLGLNQNHWLISPLFRIENHTKVHLNFMEIVKNPKWSSFKILISTNFYGQNPKKATWKELTRPLTPKTDPQRFVTVQQQNMDLMPLIEGHSFVVAFCFEDQSDPQSSAWEVVNLTLTGQGPTPLKVIPWADETLINP